MESTRPSGSSSPPMNSAKKIKRTSFFCARCDRYFSNLQSYSRHRNVHARNDMIAMMRRQAIRSFTHCLIQSTRLRYAPIHQHRHVQPRLRAGPYHTQTRDGSVSSGGPASNFDSTVGAVVARNLIPYSNLAMTEPVPSTNHGNVNMLVTPFLGESSADGSRRAPVVARNLIPYPNPAMTITVPITNHGNANEMVTSFIGETSAGGSRRAPVLDGPNHAGTGEERENQDLDLNLRL